ncbi:alanine--glyoxylate aminotransferase 2, mitochondrial-like [Carcharodon carcharias]|uniref:alanine--glyoxylate aminotransferase 2, mitochondrial-like n=1 Tax=Carcharodon carcharias TaxID=13397 RepID=UPI001B7ECBC6|nr:alanine--glyoxylate aminotransferase 2, mitochondrial-like [Carcharodon carcharias]
MVVRPWMPATLTCSVAAEGLSYDATLRIRRQNLSHLPITYYNHPLLIHQGHMQWVWDMDGCRYLDFFGGIVTISIGHCHPRVTAVSREQVGRLCHTTNIYLQPPIHLYVQKLTSLLPPPLQVVMLVNSGSEANDLAMLLARVHTHNHNIITLRSTLSGGFPRRVECRSSMASAGFSETPFSGVSCPPGSSVEVARLVSLTLSGRTSPTGTSNSCDISSTCGIMCPDVFQGLWGGSQCRDSPVQTLRSCNCSPAEVTPEQA